DVPVQLFRRAADQTLVESHAFQRGEVVHVVLQLERTLRWTPLVFVVLSDSGHEIWRRTATFGTLPAAPSDLTNPALDTTPPGKPEELRLGSRVRAVRTPDDAETTGPRAGDIGVVRVTPDDTHRVGVEWERYIGGHDLENRCPSGYGWWVDRPVIEIISNKPV